jgi:hypothetical protein
MIWVALGVVLAVIALIRAAARERRAWEQACAERDAFYATLDARSHDPR